jgi:hypothetical protein
MTRATPRIDKIMKSFLRENLMIVVSIVLQLRVVLLFTLAVACAGVFVSTWVRSRVLLFASTIAMRINNRYISNSQPRDAGSE